jgi:hypothetical protein
MKMMSRGRKRKRDRKRSRGSLEIDKVREVLGDVKRGE